MLLDLINDLLLSASHNMIEVTCSQRPSIWVRLLRKLI